MAVFVLVAGAWHAGWCWRRVAPLLEAAGHRALAPDLLGMGDDATPLGQITLDSWAEQIAGLLAAQPEPVILVGHSRGGIVISAAAERAPERIARLVYLAAFLVPDGETLMAQTRHAPLEALADVVRPAEGGGSEVAPEAVGRVFYHRTDAEWVAVAAANLAPEPSAPMVTPVRTSAARFGSVPRAYIECADDRAVPLALQRAMQEVLPCDPVITMAGDHSPFFSDPEGLARHLIAIAEA